MGGSGNVPIHPQRIQKGLDLRLTHLGGVALPMEIEVSFRPLHVRLLRTQAVVLQAQTIPYLVEQPGSAGNRVGIGGHGQDKQEQGETECTRRAGRVQ